MGKQLGGIKLGILLAAFASPLFSEEAAKPEKLSFTIQSGENRELHWGVTFPEGQERDLSESEMEKLFEEEIFPRVLADAKAGREPEVWQIGFFYLDGKGTKQDLEQAEKAFRRGLSFDHPEGLLFFGDHFQEKGIAAEAEPAKRDEYFLRAEMIYREVLDAGFPAAARFAIPLATAHLFGWYGLEPDTEKAKSILRAVEKTAPDDPSCKLWFAKVFIKEKKFTEAFDYAEDAQKTFEGLPEPTEDSRKELKLARAVKITAAVLGGEVSKIDPKEFLEISKESLGLTGRMAWIVPVILLLILGILLWRTRLSWEAAGESQGGPAQGGPAQGGPAQGGPGLRLSIMWVSAAVLAAGIGFNIRLPGLDNGIGHWIGAILVTITCLVAMKMAGWSRHFGSGPLFRGAKPFFLGLGIIVVGLVGMQLVAMGYGALYKMVLGKGLDQQLVSLFLKSENLLQLAGTVLIVGVAIPFYEEVFFRGFLYDALERRWSVKVALVASSVSFALVHGLTFAIPLLFLSFALGWLRMKKGNLRMCFFLHAANNSSAVLIGYFNQGG